MEVEFSLKEKIETRSESVAMPALGTSESTDTKFSDDELVHAPAPQHSQPHPHSNTHAVKDGDRENNTSGPSANTPPEKPPIMSVEAFGHWLPKPSLFYIDASVVFLFSIVIALFGVVYMNLVMAFPLWWYQQDGNEDFAVDPTTMQLLQGRWWWILVGTLTGLTVGTLRVLLKQTGPIPSFVQEVQTQHADPVSGIKTCLLACISLMGGASVGPEAGLGAFGGVMGHLVATKLCTGPIFAKEQDLRRRLFTLCGISAAFGAFMPTAFVAVMLVMEIGMPFNTWGITYMRMFTFFAVAGLTAFVVYTNIIDHTFLSDSSKLTAPGQVLYVDEWYNVFIGMSLGVLAAAVALFYCFVGAVVKIMVQVLFKVAHKTVGHDIGFILIAALGGSLYGLFGFISPLVMGDGIEQMGVVIEQGAQIGTVDILIGTILKIFAYHVCIETGFVGGLFLPIVAIGINVMRIMMNETSINGALAISCGFAMIPGALVPIPVTLVVFSANTFILGPAATIPIFACVITAYFVFMAMGLPQFLARKGYERRNKSLTEFGGEMHSTVPKVTEVTN
ncbi:hypothetical protein SARC_01471 [Sphaeroforma arctica JP610]|uniref:Chloride channel protein n=1 Tax=Sphaeroforma arctica JP610 TaxID=667725 RepID=A0A0L0GBJ5_9EUKA|nr:hypothetical protein SARC_01471 [Sphaeroforma arctica JP610]KNC86375.1 hypothetical protein SARC_01471 [Sphaeroforma arctica JP610]|eukprot:XP_014160277.1 hypothetical protein SARC_01471 [Sphaeroforma arctica JP610]